MPKISFKTNEPYKGVKYAYNLNNKFNWKFKHQVPILSELPKEYIGWSNLRFPYHLVTIPNDSGERYSDFNIGFEPIKVGDVIYNFGSYIGVVSETRTAGNDETGFYIEIVYNKVFENINNQNVLVDKIRVDTLDMRSFLFFYYYGLRIYKLSGVKYVETSGIIPHYQSIINEQNTLIKNLKSELEEYKKILGNLDKRIKSVAYQKYVELDELKNPRKPEVKKELSEAERKRIQELEFESTHRVAESLRKLHIAQEEYDAMPWLDKWCGKRPERW
jgi:hypothetical protein